MKKITLLAAAAIVAAGFASCGKSTPKADLKTNVDSLSYAIGMAQTQGLKEYLVSNLGVDTAYIDEFIKGLNEGANAGDDKKKAAYYAGIQIGQQISNQMVRGINHELFGEDSTKTISEELHGWLHQRNNRQEGTDDRRAGTGTGTAQDAGNQRRGNGKAVWRLQEAERKLHYQIQQGCWREEAQGWRLL